MNSALQKSKTLVFGYNRTRGVLRLQECRLDVVHAGSRLDIIVLVEYCDFKPVVHLSEPAFKFGYNRTRGVLRLSQFSYLPNTFHLFGYNRTRGVLRP